MAEPRFNNPYFWPPPPSMPGQVSPLVTFNYCDIAIFHCHLFPCVNVFSAIQQQSDTETIAQNLSQFLLVDSEKKNKRLLCAGQLVFADMGCVFGA